MPQRTASPLSKLLPTVRHAHTINERFRFANTTRLHLPLDAGDADRHTAGHLAGVFKQRTGRRPRLTRTTRYIQHHVIWLGEDDAFDIPRHLVPEHDEGYGLRIDRRGILLAAHDAPGLAHAVRTLTQWLDGTTTARKAAATAGVAGVEITDWPAMRWRGVMVDVGRQVERTDHLERMIRDLAHYKKNMFVLYFEDKYRWRSRPELAHDIGYTADDFARLARVADEQHVQFVPALASLGHCEGLLRHPSLAPLREEHAVYQLSLRHAGTRRLLRDLYEELLPLYAGQFFHVNCDESPLLAGPENAGKKWFRESLRLFRDHLVFLHDLCAAHGKRIMVWGDMLLHHGEILDGLPRDILIVDWDYGPMLGRKPRAATAWFVDQGFDVLVAPAAGRSAEIGVIDHMQLSDNVPGFIQLGRDAGAVGEMTTMWEMFTTNPLVLWPGLVASAQCAWADKTNPARLGHDVAAHLYGQGAAAPLVKAWQKLGGDAFSKRYFGGRTNPEVPGYRTYHIDAHELVPTDPMLYLTYRRDDWPRTIVRDATAGLEHLRQAIGHTEADDVLEAFEAGGTLQLYQGMLRQAVDDAAARIIEAERARRRGDLQQAAGRVTTAAERLRELDELAAGVLDRVVRTWKRTRRGDDPALDNHFRMRLRLTRRTLRSHIRRLDRAAARLRAGRDAELGEIVGGQNVIFYDARNPSPRLVDVWHHWIEASDDARHWRRIMAKGWFILERQHYAIAQVLEAGWLPRHLRVRTRRLHIDPKRYPLGERLRIRAARTLTPAQAIDNVDADFETRDLRIVFRDDVTYEATDYDDKTVTVTYQRVDR